MGKPLATTAASAPKNHRPASATFTYTLITTPRSPPRLTRCAWPRDSTPFRALSMKPTLSFLLAALLLTSGCATVGKNVHGIENFDEVQSGVLYRGAQPDRTGIDHLKQQGVK